MVVKRLKQLLGFKDKTEEELFWFEKGQKLRREANRASSIIVGEKENPSMTFNVKVYGDAKGYEEALKCFDKVIELNPKEGSAWNEKGMMLCHLKRYEEALECFDKTLKLSPEQGVIWNNKGNALLDLSFSEEALICFKNALTAKIPFPFAELGKGKAEDEIREKEKKKRRKQC